MVMLKLLKFDKNLDNWEKVLSIEDLIKPHLRNVISYDPVDPPEMLAQKAGVPIDQIIKLNGNENPFGPSEKVSNVVANSNVHVYPDPLQRKVRTKLSEYTGFAQEYLVAGAGSDELIDLLFRLFIEPGDNILDFDPTFGMYGFCARIYQAEVKLSKRDNNFEIDLENALNTINDRTKIIFVASPNNPTGNLASEIQIRALLETGVLVVVDEAYYEFCNSTFANLIDVFDNLVILRTMSKWAGLAGLRIGYGIMNPVLVNHIMDIKSPYNLSVTAEDALVASIDDAGFLLNNVRRILVERDRVFKLLTGIDGLRPIPSSGNYILCEVKDQKKDHVVSGLENEGIFVRTFNTEALGNYFRTAIGTPDQSDRMISVLQQLV